MIFFLILPLWICAVLLGVLMLVFRPIRWLGIHLIVISTLATACSLLASTVGMLGGGAVGQAIDKGQFGGLFAIGGYGVGLIGGGLFGAFAGFALTLFFQIRSGRPSVRKD